MLNFFVGIKFNEGSSDYQEEEKDATNLDLKNEQNGQHIKDENENTQLDDKDVEGSGKKLKYPYSIGFIIGNEFCER